ncbi:hypothetical protein [Paludibacterium paludis]|uniref:Lipoprotein n=1 Tax=Paludibacterium paludis TaxID=1225769 RepID=A0A918U983_9NEIS|nr:hypothetical protein [Paludibacterium paludis]GGY10947.1 hypothetical protein GCM10011289_12220 [Paludibacterium paludis]
MLFFTLRGRRSPLFFLLVFLVSARLSACEPPSPVTEALLRDYPTEIASVTTFRTTGLSRQEADDFLKSAAGSRLLDALGKADPGAAADTLYARALDLVLSGSDAPRLISPAESLVKLVPHGQSVSAYSAYFTTMDEVERIDGEGRCFADAFAVPVRSEAARYDLYAIEPRSADALMFASTIAPARELDGKVIRRGGAMQYLVPNRKDWSEPRKLRELAQ